MTGKHKAFGIYVHITWHTWRRQRLIDRMGVPEILKCLAEAAQRHGVHIREQAVLTEHVHIIASLRPDRVLSDFIRHAKSESARRPNSPRRPFRWARGYFVETLSRTHVRRACAYVAGQYRKHPDRILA